MMKYDMTFKQYNTVKIIAITNPKKTQKSIHDLKAPQVGDIATILEIYQAPTLAYELECSNTEGITQWLQSFEATEIEMQHINR